MDTVQESAEVVQEAPESNPTNPITDPRPEPVDEKVQEPPEPEVEKKPEDPIPKGVQKRIDRAVRQKYEAEARAKMLEERVAQLEQRQPQPQQKTVDNSEPKIENFDNFDEFVTAKAQWIANKQIEQTLTEREKRQAAERETTERQKTVDGWNKRLAAATAEMPDFEEVVSSSEVPMTAPMQQAIMESDIGPKLAYYLASNPEEAEKIAQMSPLSAVRSLGRIEERLATQKPVTKSTSAPEPIKPVKTTATVTKDPGKMSDKEYAQWRRSGRAA